jgi:hypothetical protein
LDQGLLLRHVHGLKSLYRRRKMLVQRLPIRHVHSLKGLYTRRRKLVQRLHIRHVHGLKSLFTRRKKLVQRLPNDMYVDGTAYIRYEKSCSRDFHYGMYMA